MPADGIVDGTSPKIAESGLKIFGLSGGQWVDVEKIGGKQLGVDAENNLVSANISMPSVYLLMAPVAATTLDQVVVYPNPFQLWKNDFVTFGGKEPGRRLPSKATIRLYTVSGELVTTIEETDGDGDAAWDGRNEDREEVSSGVYIYVITSDDGRTITGKLAVIR
ncbi:MAG: T9SS type A sorting domain-containing protein [bacterium]|nr:T9SS type A sorting domain-containing protein [bacterium]